MKFVTHTLVRFGFIFFYAAVTMVGLHFAHQGDVRLPAFGYMTCVWLCILAEGIIGGSVVLENDR